MPIILQKPPMESMLMNYRICNFHYCEGVFFSKCSTKYDYDGPKNS